RTTSGADPRGSRKPRGPARADDRCARRTRPARGARDLPLRIGRLLDPGHHGGQLRPPLRRQRAGHLAAAEGLRRAGGASGRGARCRRSRARGAASPATGGGAVIALTSDHTVHNLPYGATKGALGRLVLAATHELADRGIRPIALNPGPIDTGWMSGEIGAAGAAATPGGHLGGPETVSDLVRFLVSEQGAWIRGQ